MSILARLTTLRDLRLAASLPASAVGRLQRPLAIDDLESTTIKKPRGGYRIVRQPLDDSLTRLQKRLKEFIDTKVLEPHPGVHGFTRGRSTHTNASAHLHAEAVMTVDIHNFFDSITKKQVILALSKHGANASIAEAIANVTTFNDQLVTGFSTSPVLSNLVFLPVDVDMQRYADRNGLIYTRYADDITFSGTKVSDEDLVNVAVILSEYGFRVNAKKVKFQRRGHRQIVTGYTIAHADHVRLPKAAKRRLRQDLYYVKRQGLAAQANFRDVDEDPFKEGLLGRINYLMSCERSIALRMRAEFEEII